MGHFIVDDNAPGYDTTRAMIEVPEGKPVERVVVMKHAVAMGRLVIRILDDKGRPVEATLSGPGIAEDRPTVRYDRMTPAGSFDVRVSAAGYASVVQPISLAAGGDVEVVVVLKGNAKATGR